MTLQSKSKITCITRLVLASMFLAGAWVSASAQTNTFPSSGNVGIGTTTPGAALNVSTGSVLLGATTTNLNQLSCKLIMRVGTNQNLCFESSSNASTASLGVANDANTAFADFQLNANNLLFFGNNVERMRITSTGNIGIGTTNPAVKLHSQVSSPNTGTPTGSDMGMFINNSDTTANNYALIGFGNAFPQFQAAIGSVNLGTGANAGGHLVFHSRPAAGATAERMRIDSSGKVGIGTTAPGGKLHIYDLTAGVELIGRIQHADDSSASSNSIWRVISGNLGTSKLEFTSSSFWRAAIWSGANKDLQFYTGGQPSAATERMRILDTGTIGIGLSNPNTSYKLDVNGAINATALNVNGSPIISTQWTSGSGNINYTSGNVGIGTTSPQRTLDLGTSGQLTFGNNGYSSTASPGFFWYTDNVNYGIYKSAGSWSAPNYQQLTLNFSTGIVIDGGSAYGKSGTVLQPNGGKVGIGVTNPGGILDVERTANDSGVILRLGNGNTGAIYDFTRNSATGNLSLQGNQVGYNNILLAPSSGNIGIGTTAPAYKLDVAGIINSSSGGFRFPDGSVQTTAASGGGGSVASVFGRTGAVVAAANDYTWAQINKTTSSLGDLATRNAGDLTSGILPDARFPATLPAASGTNLTFLNAANLSSGTVAPARLGSGTANSTTFLRGDNSWVAITSSQWITTGANINYDTGNVGIGTSAPTEKLQVTGNGKITGNLTVDGNIAAKYQDLAEWVPSSEQLSAGTVVVLDTTKSNQVISSTVSYDTRVAGVISAQPGITLGESGEGKVLVATTGRVRVKVDASRGPIQIGDLLVTSDVAGVAMKSEAVELAGRKMHMPGTIIGKALEPLAKGSGEILVLLSLQ